MQCWLNYGEYTNCTGEATEIKRLPLTLYGDEPEFFYACDPCWEAYHDHWKEQWDEYYAEIRAGISATYYG